jgi:hypothetical protein
MATRAGPVTASTIAAAQRLMADVLAHVLDEAVDPEAVTAAAAVHNATLHHPDRPMRIREIIRRAPPEVPLLRGTRDRPATKSVQRTRFAYTEILTTMAGVATSRKEEEAPITERDRPSPRRHAAEDDTRAPPPRPRVRFAPGQPLLAAHEMYHHVTDHCAELLAMLGRHRAEGTWSARGEHERRILEQTDALCATGGDVVKRIATWWAPVRPSPDPWRTWAAVFALAALEGPDSMDAVGRGIERLAPDARDHGRAASEALVATSHPDQQTLLRDLLVSPHPLARAAAIDVLSRRGAMSAGELRPHLMDLDPLVLGAALDALPRLEPTAGGMLAWTRNLMRYPDPEVAWAAARTLLRWRRPEPLFELRRGGRLREMLDAQDALELLVLAGTNEDIALVLDIASSMRMTPRGLQAVARFGHVAGAQLMLERLSDPDLGAEAARGLARLAGARVEENARLDTGAWQAAIDGLRFDAAIRYQGGEPWRPEVLVAECSRGELSRAELAARIDELGTRTGQSADLDLRLWSADVPLAQHLTRGRFAHGWHAGAWDAFGLRG